VPPSGENSVMLGGIFSKVGGSFADQLIVILGHDHIWCHAKISEVAILVSTILNFWWSLEVAVDELHLCFVIKGNKWWKRIFFGWLLSLCYITNIWSYSSRSHHMLLLVRQKRF